MVAHEANRTDAQRAAPRNAGRRDRSCDGPGPRRRRPSSSPRATRNPGRSSTARFGWWGRISLLVQVRAYGPRAVGGGWGMRRCGAGPHHPPAPMWPARTARAPPEHRPPEQGELRVDPDHRQRAKTERGRERHGRDRRQAQRGTGTSTHLEGRAAQRTDRRTHTRNPCTEPATGTTASPRRLTGDVRTTAAAAKTAWSYPQICERREIENDSAQRSANESGTPRRGRPNGRIAPRGAHAGCVDLGIVDGASASIGGARRDSRGSQSTDVHGAPERAAGSRREANRAMRQGGYVAVADKGRATARVHGLRCMMPSPLMSVVGRK